MIALKNLFKFSRRNTSKISEKFYSKVEECPIYNWNKIFTEHDVTYILKDRKERYYKHITIDRIDALLDDYTKQFGIKKKVKEYNRKRKQLAKLKLKYIRNDSRILINKIYLLEKEVNDLKKLIFSQNINNFHENNVILQKWYGQRIDLKKTSVVEYFSIVKLYEQSNKKNRHSGRGGSR